MSGFLFVTLSHFWCLTLIYNIIYSRYILSYWMILEYIGWCWMVLPYTAHDFVYSSTSWKSLGRWGLLHPALGPFCRGWFWRPSFGKSWWGRTSVLADTPISGEDVDRFLGETKGNNFSGDKTHMEWSCHEVFENWGILGDIGLKLSSKLLVMLKTFSWAS